MRGDLLYETITEKLKSSSNKSKKQSDVFRDYIDYLNSKGYEVQKLPELLNAKAPMKKPREQAKIMMLAMNVFVESFIILSPLINS